MINAGTEVAELYVKAVEAFFSKDVNAAVGIMKHRQKMDQTRRRNHIQIIYWSTEKRRASVRICSIRTT